MGNGHLFSCLLFSEYLLMQFMNLCFPDDLCIGNFDLIMAFDLSNSASQSEIDSLSNYTQLIAQR